MKIIRVQPEKAPEIVTVPVDLGMLQKEVGGYIQAVYPFEDPVALICNDESKLNGLPLNRAVYDEYGHIYDIIAGTFLVVGLGEEDFCGLSDELLQKYTALFAEPEQFIRLIDQIIVVHPDRERTR